MYNYPNEKLQNFQFTNDKFEIYNYNLLTMQNLGKYTFWENANWEYVWKLTCGKLFGNMCNNS